MSHTQSSGIDDAAEATPQPDRAARTRSQRSSIAALTRWGSSDTREGTAPARKEPVADEPGKSEHGDASFL
jgi:hypothetical protein